VKQVIPDEAWAKKVAPVAITIFFFVIAQYWMGILPIVGPITIGEHATPLFRPFVADLNMTFALALVTIVAAQIYAFKYMGFKGNMGRYFMNPLKDPIMAFVGLLELIAEFSRLLGLSFRLFGNVLAGEVLLIMIAYLSQFVSPLVLQPFYLFELFIGGIQAKAQTQQARKLRNKLEQPNKCHDRVFQRIHKVPPHISLKAHVLERVDLRRDDGHKC
jgi:F-type H+-transporting ATPase subunit a